MVVGMVICFVGWWQSVAVLLLVANWDISLASTREDFWHAAGLGQSEAISEKGKY